jgi:hypothetical protein
MLHFGPGDVDVHFFMVAEVTHHPRKDPGDGAELAWP